MRFEGQIKMGYYPTPLSVVEMLRSYMAFPEEAFSVIDPCCGMGKALAALISGTQGKSYGIELDEARADKAKKLLFKVAKGAVEAAKISHEGFSINFLNPPYDDDSGTDVLKTQRKEKVFLKRTFEYIKKGGVLIYIIPQNRLTEDVVKILVYRFRRLRAYRFPVGEYEAFSQIVVMGIRKDIPSVDKDEAERLSYYWDHTLEPPELTVSPEPVYIVPPTPNPALFRSGIIDPEELLQDIGRSSLWDRVKETGVRREAASATARPPIPLHKGHMGMALVSGALDGCVGKGNNLHLVKGRVVKDTVEMFLEDEDGAKKIERDSYIVTVQILTNEGDVISLMGDKRLEDKDAEQASA